MRGAHGPATLGAVAVALPALTHPAWADPPLSYLHGFGTRADPVVALTWGLLIISIVVSVIMCALVGIGIWRRRVPLSGGPISLIPVQRGGSGLQWLSWGVGISTVVLFGALIWTVVVLAAVGAPPRNAALTIEVTGQQWWWRVRYLNSDPSRIFTTAGEIHIPVGQPVRVRLISTDVIHSFWVPALSGKTDTIPGQTNEAWLQASQPGVYRGQCSEYCGHQHAHMGFDVVAEPADKFNAWMNRQLHPAPAPASAEIAQGEHLFVYRCGACHTVRGSGAGGILGPDLTHLMSRGLLAGDALSNNIGDLSAWILNPQAIKPGAKMPILDLSGPEIQSIRSYLVTLK
ncbi:MAG: cytochrome c oxidase subunit II [Pseudomonadota bacterium]|nr:cytochrome c oxidase subunit II [Pseudomonadota bacterium]